MVDGDINRFNNEITVFSLDTIDEQNIYDLIESKNIEQDSEKEYMDDAEDEDDEVVIEEEEEVAADL